MMLNREFSIKLSVKKRLSLYAVLAIVLVLLMPVVFPGVAVGATEPEMTLPPDADPLQTWRYEQIRSWNVDRETTRVIDNADLLTAEQIAELNGRALELGKTYNADIVIVTQDDLGKERSGGSESDVLILAQDFADDAYDYSYYSQDGGVLLLHSSKERAWHISTTGSGIGVFTDYGIERIGEELVPFLKEGDFFATYSKFLDLADRFYMEARDNKPYDVDHVYKSPRNVWKDLRNAAIISAIIAFIVLFILRRSMKTARLQSAADYYVRAGSFKLVHSRDNFLYSTTTSTKVSSENSSGGGGGSSTHTGSSGSSHGGGGGRY